MLDCTFNTNRYAMPLLEAVGATSTDKTFTIAYAFMGGEEMNNYVFVLQFIRRLFVSSPFPNVIVTDREYALMNAVRFVFPESRRHLCRRHIEQCVYGKALSQPGFEEKYANGFKYNWNWAISAGSKEEFQARWEHMEEKYRRWPGLLDYCTKTWIGPHAAEICSYSVDQYLHFGSYTTNR